MTFDKMEIPLIVDMTLDDIAAGLDSGQFTSVQLVKTFLARIKEVDHIFRSILEINPHAIRVAQELDEEKNVLQKRRSPLHGVPLLLKDNIVAKEMEATAGSFALLGAKPAQESSVVTRLRAAGAILLGKANMSEWAYYRSIIPVLGWSPRGGQCTSSYYPNMLAEGSSTGSAVSTALGLAFAALGTETGGSIVGPASRNNVVGLKPTTGLVARDAIIPASYRLDTVGPLARTVKDAAHILTLISGKSAFDERTHDNPFTTMPDFAAPCAGTNLQGIRIGVPRDTFPKGSGSVIEDAFTDALGSLTQAGAKIVDTSLLAAEEFATWSDTKKETTIYADMKTCLPKYFASLEQNPNNLHTLEDLMDYTKNEPREDFSRDIGKFELAQSIDTESQQFQDIVAFEQYIAGEGGIAATIKRSKLDVLAVPSTASTPKIFSDIEGSPTVSVPLGSLPLETPIKKAAGPGGFIEEGPNLPFSIVFLAKRYEEQTLLRVAYAFEQLTKVRNQVQPYKAPTTELRSMISERRETTLETEN